MRCLEAQEEAAEAAGVPATEAMQPVAAEEAGQVEGARAEEVEVENLPPVHHKAWEAERLRALNEVLSVELQPEELLLEAVEAPWREESGEESSGGEMEVGSSLQPGGLAPKRMRDVTSGQKTGSRRQGGAGGKKQGNGKWSMPGFSADPGGTVLVAGRYIVKAVQSQVILQGPAGREIWLGVDLRRGGAME